MNREIPQIPALIFIASLVVCFALFIQRANTFAVPTMGQFFEQAGELKLLFSNQIVNLEHDSKEQSLDKFDIKHHVGQLGVGDDQSIYINRGGQSTSIYSLFKEKSGYVKGESSLLKCAGLNNCMPWGDRAFQFDTAWSMFSVGNGLFIINDTMRHQIHLVNSNGQRLDTLGGFKFPNHVLRHDNSYWVVNTNTNSLIQLTIDRASFSKTGKQIKFSDYVGIPATYRYPSIAYSLDNDRLIVLTHPYNMNRGQVFLLQPDSADRLFDNLNDITAIYVRNDVLYVADYETHSLWSQKPGQGAPTKVTSSSYAAAVMAKQSQVQQCWYDFLALVFVILLAGFAALVYALKKSKLVKNYPNWIDDLEGVSLNEDMRIAENVESKVVRLGELKWIRRDRKFEAKLSLADRVVPVLIAIEVIGIIGFIFFVLFLTELPERLASRLLLLGGVQFLFFIMLWFIYKVTKKIHQPRVGADGRYIYFTNRHKQIRLLPDEVHYNQYIIYGKGFSVPIRYFNRLVLDQQSFTTFIAPLLLIENKLSTYALFILRLKNNDTLAYVQVGILVINIIMGAILIFLLK